MSPETETKVSPFAAAAGGDDLPIIEISPAAMETVMSIRAGEDDPDALALRVEITGANGREYVYDLSFDELVNAAATDVVVEVDGISVIVPEDTVERLRGSVLDLPRSAGQGGLVIRNPNRPDPLAGVELDRSGTLAEQVQELLEKAINPSLAAHGGFATLLGVDDERQVYITMGGGCQGCAASKMTLTEGIKAQITDLIPEVVDVIDATDHAAGENPFYS